MPKMKPTQDTENTRKITVNILSEKELFKSALAGDVKYHLDEISDCEDSLAYLRDRLIESVWKDYWAVEHAVPNMWECPTSPIGTCVYHKFEDRAWDNCLFCHDPYERK